MPCRIIHKKAVHGKQAHEPEETKKETLQTPFRCLEYVCYCKGITASGLDLGVGQVEPGPDTPI
jgi:hypothetical protein